MSNFKQLPQVKSYEKYPLWKLQKMFPYIHWVNYINALLPAPLSVDANEEVILWVPHYFNGLGKLLNATSKRVTANFLMWKMVEYSINFLDKEVNERRFVFEAMIHGKRKLEPKWITCTDVTNERCDIFEHFFFSLNCLCYFFCLFFA